MPLPSETQRLPLTLEVAWGADRSNPGTWVWTDESDRLLSQEIPVTRGQDDESSQPQPSTTNFELSNLDGALTPDNPSSPLWPNVRRNTPCRIIGGGDVIEDSWLQFVGTVDGRVSTEERGSLTGDLDIRVDLIVDPKPVEELASHAFDDDPLTGPTGGDFSWILWKRESDRPVLFWTDTSEVVHEAEATEPVPLGERLSLQVTFDIDDGVGGRVVTFYTGPAGSLSGPWTQLGDPVTGAATSLRDVTVPINIGAITSQPLAQTTSRFYQLEVRDGIGGTAEASTDLRSLTTGATSWTDSVGRTWTLHGQASIVDPTIWRFFGEISSIAPVWPHGDLSGPNTPGEARVRIEAAGILRRLAQGAKPLASTMYRRIASPEWAEGLAAYWPMEDGRDASRWASPVPGVRPATFGGENLQLASDDTLPSSAPLPSISSGGAGWNAPVPVMPTGDWRIEMSFVIPTAPASAMTLFAADTTGTVRRFVVSVDAGAIRAEGWVQGNLTTTPDFTIAGFPTGWFDGIPVRVRLRVFETDVGVSATLSWTILNGSTIGGTEALLASDAGRPTHLASLFTAPADGVAFGHLTVTGPDAVVPSTWLGEEGSWTGGADTAYVGEPAALRIARLGAEEGVPVEIVGEPADSAPLGPQGQETLVSLLVEAAQADLGILSEQRAGLGLRYRTRSSLYNQTPQLALDAESRNIGDIINPLEPTYDDQALRNDVTVSRTNGGSARIVVEDSVEGEGRYDVDETVNVAADGQLPDQASWRATLGTWPGMRYRSVTSELTTADDPVSSQWATTDLGDRATLTGLPPQHPATAVDLLIYRINEVLSPSRRRVELTCRPGGPWTVAVRDEPVIAVRDTAGTETTASFEAGTDTSLAVETTVGGVWADTSEADLPFDISVAGVRLTVTAISAAVGQEQTFTVDQAPVNGVTKTIAAGADVRLWQPAIRAL